MEETRAAMEPFETLWNLAAQFRVGYDEWLHGPVFQLEAETVDKSLDSMSKLAVKSSRDILERIMFLYFVFYYVSCSCGFYDG